MNRFLHRPGVSELLPGGSSKSTFIPTISLSNCSHSIIHPFRWWHRKLLFGSRSPSAHTIRPHQPVCHQRPSHQQRFFSTGIKRMLKKDRNKWTLDDILAMGSWFFVGNTLFVLLATTSSVSLLLAVVNSLQFQGFLAKKISQALTKETGIEISFKEAIVPRWRDGMIRLSAVHARRELDPKEQCTHFDVTIDRIDLSLDLMRWLNGKGLVRELHVRGVRGQIDRRHLDFTGVDPSEWLRRRQPSDSDWDLREFRMQDCFMTVLDYNNFRPYTFQFHDMHCPRLRTQWLIYDIWNADTLVGEYDTAVFSLSRPRTEAEMGRPSVGEFQPGRTTKIRVYGLPIDFLDSGDDSPFGWLKQGTVDFDMLHTASRQEQEGDKGVSTSTVQGMIRIAEQMQEIRNKLMGEVVEPIKVKLIEDLKDLGRLLDDTLDNGISSQTQQSPPVEDSLDTASVSPEIVIDVSDDKEESSYLPAERDLSFLLDIRFNNIRAEMPAQTSGTTSLLVRPIIAYLNAQSRNGKSATPPVTVKFKLPFDSFDGAQTVYQCGFMNQLSETLTVALSRRVLIRYNNYLKQGRRRHRKSAVPAAENDPGWYTWAFGWITSSSPASKPLEEPVPSGKSADGLTDVESYEGLVGDYNGDDDNDNDNDDDDDDHYGDEDKENDERWVGRIAAGMGWWSLKQLCRQIVYSWESNRQTGSMFPRSSEEGYDEMYNEIIWGHP